MNKPMRNGDVNLHPISKVKGEIVKHEGSFILARGEATGSLHKVIVKNREDLIVRRDNEGRMYFELLAEGELTHTHDHATTKIMPGRYVQVPEREVDHFADSIVRKVID